MSCGFMFVLCLAYMTSRRAIHGHFVGSNSAILLSVGALRLKELGVSRAVASAAALPEASPTVL